MTRPRAVDRGGWLKVLTVTVTVHTADCSDCTPRGKLWQLQLSSTSWATKPAHGGGALRARGGCGQSKVWRMQLAWVVGGGCRLPRTRSTNNAYKS